MEREMAAGRTQAVAEPASASLSPPTGLHARPAGTARRAGTMSGPALAPARAPAETPAETPATTGAPEPLARVTVAEAWLESPRVLGVRFADGRTDSFALRRLPFATGGVAGSVEIRYEGDMVALHAPTGDWEVLADELRLLAERGRLDDPAMSKRVGASCRRARLERGLTQKDVAALTGIAAPNLSRVERGGTPPRLRTLERLAAAYGTTVVDLVRE